jgi:nitrite reductase (NADH) small subunit
MFGNLKRFPSLRWKVSDTTTEKKWIRVADLEDIPVLGARVVQARQETIALFRNSENEVFAVEDRCPHKGGPLSQGIVHGKTVTCPLHAWNIDLQQGCALEPDVGCVKTYELKMEGSVIWLSLS